MWLTEISRQSGSSLLSLAGLSAVQGGMRDQARHRASTNRSVGNLQPPNYPTAPREEARSAHREGQQALDEERNELVAEEHSSWWFCPCDDDPSFFYPVSECFDGKLLIS